MSVLVILIGVSITIASGFLISYLWAIKSGQYDDKHTPAMRILFDDNKPTEENNSKTEKINHPSTEQVNEN